MREACRLIVKTVKDLVLQVDMGEAGRKTLDLRRAWAACIRAPKDCDASTDTYLEKGVAEITSAGGAATIVLDPWSAPSVEPLASRLEMVDHPVTGPVAQLRNPIVVDGIRPATLRPAPLFDQHTDEVIGEVAGYDEERLAELRAAEVIGGRLPPPASIGLRF